MAASAQGIRAGRAYVEASLSDNLLTAGLRKAEARLKAFGASVAGIGAKLVGFGTAIATPFVGAAKAFADTGSQLNDMSARTGLSVEALSALSHAATQSGTDLETVEGAVRKMQKALLAGSEENLQAAGTFASLGLSVAKLARLSPEQQFAVIAKAIARIPSPTFKAAAAMQVFGKSGTALLPMIGELGALTQEARDFGLVWTGDEAKQADALGDALDLLWKVGRRVFEVIGSALAPTLTDLSMRLARAGKMAMDWVANNKELVVLAFKIAAGVIAAGAALVVLGTVISGVGSVLGAIAAGFALIGSLVGFLVSPIGLVIAGLTGLTAWFLTSTQAGGQALAWLGERFGELKADALAAFGGIADALRAGDIALAGQILWAFLKVEWIKGINFLKAAWAEWSGFAVDVWSNVTTQLASLMTDAWAGIKSTWVSSVGFLQDAWSVLGGFVQSTWATSVNFIMDAWDGLVGFLIKGINSFAGRFAQEWAKIRAIASGKFITDPHALVDELVKIDEEVARQNAGIDVGGAAQKQARHAQADEAAKARGAGLLDAGKARQAELDQIEADRAAAQKALVDQQGAGTDARRKALQEGLAAGADDLAKAQEDLKALNEQAANEAVAAGRAAKGPRPFTPEGLGLGLEQAAQKVETKGTFSAAALRGLGVGDTAGDTLKEQKKATEELKKLNDKARRGQIVFNEP